MSFTQSFTRIPLLILESWMFPAGSEFYKDEPGVCEQEERIDYLIDDWVSQRERSAPRSKRKFSEEELKTLWL